MSKSALKKHLQSLTKEQLIEIVLETYDNIKPAKEYFEYYLNPNDKEMYFKFKAIIVNEFYPKGKYAEPKTRFSVAKKAISDYRSLKPSPELLGDLMFTLAEMSCKFTYDYGDMWEQYYNSAYTNFKNALIYLQKNNLLDNFKLRCLDCVRYASPCGYGFAGDISEIYYEYYE
ncbi:MAG: DUF6155 family protein [Paludibacter sp.]|nr:DUF6155 family protein [Paludibacter sp.]